MIQSVLLYLLRSGCDVGFRGGRGPDLGPHELDEPLPHYGPRGGSTAGGP